MISSQSRSPEKQSFQRKKIYANTYFVTLGNLEPRCIIYSHTDSKRSFQTTIYLEWHRSSRKLRLPAEVDPRGKRRLYRGDKGRRGRYGKSSLEKKKELIGDQLKRSSKRVHDAAG